MDLGNLSGLRQRTSSRRLVSGDRNYDHDDDASSPHSNKIISDASMRAVNAEKGRHVGTNLIQSASKKKPQSFSLTTLAICCLSCVVITYSAVTKLPTTSTGSPISNENVGISQGGQEYHSLSRNLSQNQQIQIIDSSSFKKTNELKSETNLDFQVISDTNPTVTVNGKTYSLDVLDPIDIYTADATFTIDDEVLVGESSTIEPHVFVGKEGGDTVMVTTGSDGELLTVDVFGEDGTEVSMGALVPGIVATVKSEDLDPDFLERFKYGSIDYVSSEQTDDDTSTFNQSEPAEEIESEPDVSENQDGRSLQSGCSNVKVIKMAVAFDSTFCQNEGGSYTRAKQKIERIVGKVSTKYQSQGICTMVRISHVEGHCNSSSDPYRAGINLGRTGCGGHHGVLHQFQAYFKENNPFVTRDVAHLFYGKGLNDGAGCAYQDVLCNKSWGYAVNQMYTSNEARLVDLVTNTLGHNAVGSSSVSVFKSRIAAKSCLSQEKNRHNVVFVLKNFGSGKVLDVQGGKCDNGTNIHLWSRNDSGAQIFRYDTVTKQIINVKCNKAVDLSWWGNACNPNGSIHLWSRHGGNNQKWDFEPDGSIRSVQCPNLVIDIQGSWNGANLVAHTTNVGKTWDKLWQVIDV